MTIPWVEDWELATGGRLDQSEREFLAAVETHGRQSSVLWSEPGRALERLAMEGPANAPRLVTYFRVETRRPGLLMAFEWPLRNGSDRTVFGVWLGNLMELLDEAGSTLPQQAGPDGVAKAGALNRP